MFKRSSAQLTTPLDPKNAEFIIALKRLLNAYNLRSLFTLFTGDVVVKRADGTEVDRTALKARVTQDLINAIQEGCENIREALVTSTDKHGLTPNGFLDGKTREFLNNDELFELLSTPTVSNVLEARNTAGNQKLTIHK